MLWVKDTFSKKIFIGLNYYCFKIDFKGMKNEDNYTFFNKIIFFYQTFSTLNVKICL